MELIISQTAQNFAYDSSRYLAQALTNTDVVAMFT